MSGRLSGYEELPVLLLILVPTLLAVLAAWYYNGRRARDLRKAAALAGWSFDAKASVVPDILALALPGLPMPAAADLYNAVGAPAPAGCRAWYADARLRAGRAGSVDSSWFSFALFELQGGELPAFCLRPQVFTDAPGGEGWDKDIDLPGYADFSGLYHLRGKDGAAVERLFVSLADLFSGKPGWNVSGRGRYLLVWKPDTEAPAGSYADFAGETSGIAGAFARTARRH